MIPMHYQAENLGLWNIYYVISVLFIPLDGKASLVNDMFLKARLSYQFAFIFFETGFVYRLNSNVAYHALSHKAFSSLSFQQVLFRQL